MQARYTEALRNYVQTHSENALFSISKLSKEFMSEGLGPDDVTSMHSVAMGRIVNELSGESAMSAFHSSTEPLLEIMMNYAMFYHTHMEKHRQQIAEFEGGDRVKEMEKLASVGLILLGMTSEMVIQMESVTAYTNMMAQGGISKAKELSQIVMQEATQLQEMLKTAFLYSRKMAKRTDDRMSVVLNDLLVESIDVVRNAVRLDSVAIQTNYRISVKINVNPVEMQQALVNLIASAINIIQGSGSLMISTTIDESGAREIVALKIISSKNGPAKRPDIFSLPMAKSDVGLNIAASIIRRNGGAIDVVSGENGMHITVRMPVASKANDFIGSVAMSARQPVA